MDDPVMAPSGPSIRWSRLLVVLLAVHFSYVQSNGFRANLNCILGCYNSEFKCLFSGNDSSRYTIHSSYTFYYFILEFIFLLNSSNNIFPISLPARQYPGLSIGKVSSFRFAVYYWCSTSVVSV